MNSIYDLFCLARHVSIVHHIPGRIRLRVSPSGVKAACEIDLNRLMSGIPGVLKTRINALVGSVVIDYDFKRLPPDLWESLVKCHRDRELAAEVESRLTKLWED